MAIGSDMVSNPARRLIESKSEKDTARAENLEPPVLQRFLPQKFRSGDSEACKG